MELSDFFKSINDNKKNILRSTPDGEKHYIPFVMNRSFSYFADAVLQANFMNRYPELSKRMQYEYFLHTLKKNRRFSKWHKDDTQEKNIQTIKDYYGYSDKKAREVLTILSDLQIKQLREQLNTGGNI